MKKDNRVYLHDILQVVEKCEPYLSGLTFDEFYEDEPLHYMVVHFIQTVGEVAGRLSPEFREEHPEFPVVKAKSMRNRIIHEYDQINWHIVWETAPEDFSELKKIVQAILAKP